MIRIIEYTSGKRLEEKVVGYFRSISSTVPVKQGNEAVISDSGKAVMQLEYHIPPTVTGLCRWLCILPDTWQSYCDAGLHPEFQTATRWAAMMLEDYLVTQLLERSKGPEGVRQLLKDYESEEEPMQAPAQQPPCDLSRKRKLLQPILGTIDDCE